MLNLSLADPTHVLPLLAAFLTFLHLRMAQPARQPPGTLSSPGDSIEVQQAAPSVIGLLLFIGPLLTLWIGWHAAAGLVFYQGKRKPLISTRPLGGKAKISRPQKGWSRRKKRHRYEQRDNPPGTLLRGSQNMRRQVALPQA